MFGNPAHLSPEILQTLENRKGYPHTFDCEGQYSWELGVILFEMISGGELPWNNPMDMEEEELNLKDIPVE